MFFATREIDFLLEIRDFLCYLFNSDATARSPNLFWEGLQKSESCYFPVVALRVTATGCRLSSIFANSSKSCILLLAVPSDSEFQTKCSGG